MMWEKLKSRKFIVAIAGIVLVVLTDACGVDINAESYWAVISVVASYILGQSYVDSKNGSK